jgi:acetoin utilization deacetylase AcuC-like enzyme
MLPKEAAVRVGLVYDPVYLKHDTGEHVENSGRLESIISYLEKTKLKSQLIPISPRPATHTELATIHLVPHINHIQSVARDGGGPLDSDTQMSSGSYEAAIYAAGGAIQASDAVMEDRVDSAFALVRPPGHHATPSNAMGFCLFNNISIAAKHLLAKYGLERLAIIDFDVHHGNGTQAAFETNPQVLYVSIHQHPLYPGTGNIMESGTGAGLGTKVNIPLPPGCGDAEYRTAFEQVVVPVVKRFNPQFILVSAGYDSHWADDIALMQVSVSGFVQMVRTIQGLAGELCGNRLVLVLEGGYNLAALSASVKATFEVLLGKDNIKDPLGKTPQSNLPPDILPLIQSIRTYHNLD